METMALMIALVQFRQITDNEPDKFTSLAIFSDSQAALDLLAKPMKPKTLQYLSRFVLKSHRTIPERYTLRLYWTPGHEGIELNERADKAAKEAAEGDMTPMILPISLGGLLRHSRKILNTRGAVSIKQYKTKGKWIADALNKLEKGQAAAIFQLRCGHSPLKKFLHRIKAEENDKCDTCNAIETTAHFLVYCKKYTKQRQAFRKQIKKEKIKVDINSAIKLLDTPKVYPYLAQFIENTGRFTHLKTYLDK